jgi:hypothetical protein
MDEDGQADLQLTRAVNFAQKRLMELQRKKRAQPASGYEQPL